MNKTKLLKYSAAVIFSLVLFIVLHLIASTIFPATENKYNLSFLASLLGTSSIGILWGVIAYTCQALVYYLIVDWIPGKKDTGGLRFGISVGMLWLIGYLMCFPLVGDSFIAEIAGGICDSVPAVFLGWMLGRFTNKTVLKNASISLNLKQSFMGITIFILVIFIIRTLSYLTNIVDIGFKIDPVYSLVWTIFMGFCSGIFYVLLGKTQTTSFAPISALKFGFILFGLIWGVFILFFPLMYKGLLINTIIMFLIDTLSVSAAYYFTELIIKRSA